jgi:hypothetical protein
MLRFDIPTVCANAIRLDAFVTFLICVFAFLGFTQILVITTVVGFIRGFLHHQKDPLHLLSKNLLFKFNLQGKKENAGAKMFSAKILFIASSIALILFNLNIFHWHVPVMALMIFSTLEWGFNFCAGCWVYGGWYKLFPPNN